MPKSLDAFIGRRFGRLVILTLAHVKKSRRHWLHGRYVKGWQPPKLFAPPWGGQRT